MSFPRSLTRHIFTAKRILLPCSITPRTAVANVTFKLQCTHYYRKTSTSFPTHSMPIGWNCGTRSYSTTSGKQKSEVDIKIEEIADQYAIAKDEFEIAYEETEKNTVYAADDRATAREEMEKLEALYQAARAGPGGEEVGRRIGERVREIREAVGRLKDED